MIDENFYQSLYIILTKQEKYKYVKEIAQQSSVELNNIKIIKDL